MTAVYETPAATVQQEDLVGVVGAGGVALMTFAYVNSDSYRPPSDAEDVDIGRARAKQWVITIDPKRVIRLTRWTEGEVPFLLVTSQVHHSDADVIRFIDSLQPM